MNSSIHLLKSYFSLIQNNERNEQHALKIWAQPVQSKSLLSLMHKCKDEIRKDPIWPHLNDIYDI